MSNNYLRSTAMTAARDTMACCASVLHLDIVELWVDQGKGIIDCIYAHATKEMINNFPNILHGAYPNRSKHTVSPRLCDLARLSKKRYYVGNGKKDNSDPHLPNIFSTRVSYHLDYKVNNVSVFIVAFSQHDFVMTTSKLNFLTGMGYAIYVSTDENFEDDESDASIASGNSQLDKKSFQPSLTKSDSKSNFLAQSPPSSSIQLCPSGENTGLISLHSTNDHGNNIHTSNFKIVGNSELLVDDTKSISTDSHDGSPPQSSMNTPSRSNYNNNIGGSSSSINNSANCYADQLDQFKQKMKSKEGGLGQQTSSNIRVIRAIPQYTNTSSNVNTNPNANYLGVFQTPGVGSEGLTSVQSNDSLSKELGSSLKIENVHERMASTEENGTNSHTNRVNISPLTEECGPINLSEMNSPAVEENNQLVPNWEPVHEFCYPVSKLPVFFTSYLNVDLSTVKYLRKMGEGSNSDIHWGQLDGIKVVIKMIKEKALKNPVAIHEFEMEHGILSRLSHPNILRILGAGTDPRKYLVLEYLSKGTLQKLLSKNNVEAQGFASRLFRRPSFTYSALLSKSLELANAMDYLHSRCSKDCLIIHRDLKPDNIAFAENGVLKVLDFGLCTCIKTFKNGQDQYQMTGNTGSLRYMAPEVVLRKKYNEKVDVYSFGVLLWQMARDQVPFRGLNKENFIREVVVGGFRPKIDKSWPKAFSGMVERCWDADPYKRPSFSQIIEILKDLIRQDLEKNTPSGGRSSGFNNFNGTKTTQYPPQATKSTWF